jgi:hypothetical protein
VERRLYAALRTGRSFTGDLAKTFYQQFGILAKTLDMIHRQLQAKLKSISELAKIRESEMETRIAAKRTRIAGVLKAIAAHRKPRGKRPGTPVPLETPGIVQPRSQTLLRSLHYHKRRLAILETRLIEARKQVDEPRICSGTRKRFDAQHHLEANRFDNHQDWLREWQAGRSSQYVIEGESRIRLPVLATQHPAL